MTVTYESGCAAKDGGRDCGAGGKFPALFPVVLSNIFCQKQRKTRRRRGKRMRETEFPVVSNKVFRARLSFSFFSFPLCDAILAFIPHDVQRLMRRGELLSHGGVRVSVCFLHLPLTDVQTSTAATIAVAQVNGGKKKRPCLLRAVQTQPQSLQTLSSSSSHFWRDLLEPEGWWRLNAARQR